MFDVTSILWAVVSAITAIGLVDVAQRWVAMYDRSIPGPGPTFLFGNLLEAFGGLHTFYVENSQKYGAVFRYWIGWQANIVISDPELAKEVCLSKFMKVYHNRPEMPNDHLLLGNGINTSRDGEWTRQRRMLQPAFMEEHVYPMIDTFVEKTNIMLKKWQEHCEKKEIVDIHHDIDRLNLDILGKTTFGTDFKAQEKGSSDLQRAVETVFTDGQDPLLFQIKNVYYLPFPHYKRLRAAIAKLHDTAKTVVEKRLKSGEKKADLLDKLMTAKDRKTGETFSDELIHQQTINFLLAGFDTTTTAVTWTLYCVYTNPQVKEKLFAELKQVLNGRPPARDDFKNLPYLEMCFFEAMRLYPIVHMLIREASEDDTIGNFTVPKGTPVHISVHNIHRNPKYFDNPDKFIPERHSPEVVAKRHPYAYIPFGAGPHNCIGQRFAKVAAKTIMCMMFQAYDMAPVEGHPIEVFSGAEVLCRPKHGIKMHLTPRKYA